MRVRIIHFEILSSSVSHGSKLLYPRTWKVEAERSGVQGCPQLQNTLRQFGYVRSFQKKKKEEVSFEPDT